MKRKVVSAVIVVVCFLLQCTLFNTLALGSVKPNLLIILTSAFGFTRGHKDGMVIGFFSGLFIDIQFGELLGSYALIYTVIGFINGFFKQIYYDDDVKLPLFLIAGSELVYGIIIYIFLFMLRGNFQFIHYLGQIIIPELLYTLIVSLGLYPFLLFVNHKFEAKEKRSASKFV
ncbi:MAG: rod shape-determining protein MreD [Hespellia sp.]|nr:rod shape-determining protein MreD [Hespellia sp.]